MTRIPSWLLPIIPGVLVVLSGAAISAQDKYTLSQNTRRGERLPVVALLSEKASHSA